ncbi:MAG: serine/threonine protein kinase, partial [Deltaproteobacteria bacterium]
MTSSPLGHIGRYELLSRLAAGGMGEVFLARATGAGGFEKRLVIKRILPHLADDPEFVRRFIAEGKLVVRLRHAGIAQVLDMGEEGGVTFIAMEYVEGRDLGELARLARSGGVEMPAPLVVTIIVRLLEALDYAHTATDDDGQPLGIIHRDISPSNVMISKAGEVKLLDFGIARATERLQATTTGAIRGKYSYMSPQQAAGAALDARSDLFSVGVLMWELLAGSRPFDGDSDLLTLDRIRFHDPGPLNALAPDVPAPVAAVVERLLQKDPDARFPTAEAAMRALIAWLNEVGAVVVPRDLSAWLERVLETMPEGLRRLPSTGMSLDDLLLLGLGGESERPGALTDPAGGRAPYTRTVSAPGSAPPALLVGTYTPAP